MSKIIIYDTTLRDGSQTEGVSYTVNDKVKITQSSMNWVFITLKAAGQALIPKIKNFLR